MLRDDSGNGGGRPSAPRNVLGDRLDVCSMKPKTGFFRDGCCNTGAEDLGVHTVCIRASVSPRALSGSGTARWVDGLAGSARPSITGPAAVGPEGA